MYASHNHQYIDLYKSKIKVYVLGLFVIPIFVQKVP